MVMTPRLIAVAGMLVAAVDAFGTLPLEPMVHNVGGHRVVIEFNALGSVEETFTPTLQHNLKLAFAAMLAGDGEETMDIANHIDITASSGDCTVSQCTAQNFLITVSRRKHLNETAANEIADAARALLSTPEGARLIGTALPISTEDIEPPENPYRRALNNGGHGQCSSTQCGSNNFCLGFEDDKVYCYGNDVGCQWQQDPYICAPSEGDTCTCTGIIYYGSFPSLSSLFRPPLFHHSLIPPPFFPSLLFISYLLSPPLPRFFIAFPPSFLGRKFVNGKPGEGDITSLSQLVETGYITASPQPDRPPGLPAATIIECSDSPNTGFVDPLVGYSKHCICVPHQCFNNADCEDFNNATQQKYTDGDTVNCEDNQSGTPAFLPSFLHIVQPSFI
jgi:hypothetical protein